MTCLMDMGILLIRISTRERTVVAMKLYWALNRRARSVTGIQVSRASLYAILKPPTLKLHVINHGLLLLHGNRAWCSLLDRASRICRRAPCPQRSRFVHG